MALNRARLANIQQVGATAAALITNPASTKTWIRGIVLHNTSASTPITVELYNVPDSSGSVGTAAAANKFFEKELAIGETHYIDFPGPGLVLEDTNDTIQGLDGVGSTVTAMFMGDTEG